MLAAAAMSKLQLGPGVTNSVTRDPAVTTSAALSLPRFRQLAALGLDFLRVVPGSLDMPRDIAAASLVNLANEIVPALRG